MSLQERVYSVLIVSASENFNETTSEMLPFSKYQPVFIAAGVSEAKRYITARTFDFIIVNAPLPDEFGEEFAIDCCRLQSAAVLVLARADVYDEVCANVIGHGVFTLQKPVSKSNMSQALNWMQSARERLRGTEEKILPLKERMAEIRIVNRAKWLLVSELKMTEPDAHRYIEKSAMDNCTTKTKVAEDIINKYSN